MKQKVKNCDQFGHPIQLQFNNQGSTFNTLCGGVISIVIKVIMIVYVYSLVKKWIMFDDDQISTVIGYDDIEKWDVINQN